MNKQVENRASVPRLPQISPEIHAEFKMCCVQKNLTMKKAAEIAISEWVNNHHKGLNPPTYNEPRD